MKNDRENEKAEKLLKELESHPMTRQIREEEAATLAKRKEAAAAIQTIQGNTATLTRLDRDIENMTQP